ncbi:MAG TPA: porin [Kiloniellales bacterium]|nr:porin [Kiloniellales bacterium]
MKRSILGTTALVAVGVIGATPADAKIELGLSGYMNTYFSVASIDEGDNDPQDFNPTGIFSDGEVHFTGEVTLDNGITFGANVQLEMFGDANGTDNIDEKFAYMESSFGRIVAGSEDSAAYIMHYAAPYAGLPVNSGWVTVFIPANPDSSTAFQHPGVSTYIDWGSDENVITYYTPRFWGFQLGVTYAPTLAGNGDGKNFPVEADTETEYNNGVAVGLNYVEDFNGFGVAASVGWRWAQASDFISDLGFDDYQAISAGLQLSYAGFTIGGSYANEYDGMVSSDGIDSFSTEGQSWDAGATYNIGPWTFGVTYFQGEVEDDVADPDDDEMWAIQGGVYYAIGPGITLGGGVMYGDWDAESGFSNTGIAGAVGVGFSF